ncbi:MULTISPECIES: hypothetical protein [unclassified Niallia]|uniref:hypothetical protein n=1 Tax=unclassified Niallia TaxID=2837522 RepID=UPI0030F9208C
MLKVWDLHKKLYDARWNGEEEINKTMEQLENEFVSLATTEGVAMETINEMLGQLYIPPYRYDTLPDHLKHSNSAKKENVGRPSMGVTKKVSITLPDDIWSKIKSDIKDKDLKSMSAYFRELALDCYKGEA